MASKTSRTLVWIILALVIVGLVGFGSRNFGGGVSTVGAVGSTEIDAGRYFRELRSELNAFQASTGQSLTMVQAQAYGIDRMVLDRVISSAALDNETTRLGISVGDTEIRNQVVEIRAFQGVDGKFDREAYNFALKQSGMTASEFEASLRADVSRTILQAAVANGVTTSPVYTDTLFNYARETRDFTWASLGPAALEATLSTPTQDALNTYYAANPAQFTLPETKKITYVWLNPETLIDTISVDEADLRAVYDNRISEYVVPERRIVERLVFGSQQEAQGAADALTAGTTDFETLVGERGLTLPDVDLGDVSQAELGAAGDAVFALTEPGIAGPVDSGLGPALFRMNAILAARETSFDDAKDALHGEAAADRARRLVGDLVPELDDLLAGGLTLEDLAVEHEMELGKIDWVTGLDTGIAAYDSFREAAAAITTDDYPTIMLTADGGIFAMRLDEIAAPRLQDLEEVRADVVAGWKVEETNRLLKIQAEGYLPQFGAGESPSSLGMTEITENGETRDGFLAGTPPDFFAQVFEMAPNEWRVIEDANGVVLVRLDAINAADHNSEEAQATKANFSQRAAQEIGLDIEAAFSQTLQSQAGITLNQAVINSIHSQFP